MGHKRVGTIRMKGDLVILEEIKITPEQRDFIRRRTDWIMRDMVSMDRPVRLALMTAYFAGLNDASQVME